MSAIATSFALLVFLGNGENGPGSGDYKDVVAKGVNFLMSRVQPNGRIADESGHGYDRGFAVMALVEAYRKGSSQGSWGAVDNNALRIKTELAVNYIANCEVNGGGFNYGCGGNRGDTSVTAMMTQAIKSAEEARINVPGLDGILARLHAWLDKNQYADSMFQDGQFAGTPFYNMSSKYSYNQNGGSGAMWAAGGYIRLYVNSELKYHNAMENLAMWLDDGRKASGISADRYFNFYAHHFMRAMGDGTVQDRPTTWTDWKNDMKSVLENSRKKDGHERGSWDPVGGGRNGELGRLGTTCLSLLSLEDYYKNIKLTDG
jgi:hypothetical protein